MAAQPARNGVRALGTLLALALAGCVPPTFVNDAAAPAAPAPRVPATVEPEPPASFSVVATGDVLLHQDGSLVDGAAAAGEATGVAYDFSGVFAPVAPVLQGADLALCHLETPVAEPGGPFSGYPLFEVQPEIVAALAGAGYDACSTASNHSLDAGFDALVRTLDVLDAAGVAHTGTFRSVEEGQAPRILDVNGVRVGYVSWTYGLNGIPLPEGMEWSVNVFDPTGPDVAGMLADAARARQAGADVVIASVHCCEEYVHEPTRAQDAIATALLASPDVDLVLGHHAHVVQPFERIGDGWVVHGLGNHVAEQGAGETEDSVIARFTFTEGDDGRFTVTTAEAIPTRIDLGGDAVAVVPTGADRDPDSYDRVVEVLGLRGAPADGLVIAGR